MVKLDKAKLHSSLLLEFKKWSLSEAFFGKLFASRICEIAKECLVETNKEKEVE